MKYSAALLLGFAAWALADELNIAGELNTADKTDYSGQLDALSPADLPQPRYPKVEPLFNLPWTTNAAKFDAWECEVSRNRSSNRSMELIESVEILRCAHP